MKLNGVGLPTGVRPAPSFEPNADIAAAQAALTALQQATSDPTPYDQILATATKDKNTLQADAQQILAAPFAADMNKAANDLQTLINLGTWTTSRTYAGGLQQLLQGLVPISGLLAELAQKRAAVTAPPPVTAPASAQAPMSSGYSGGTVAAASAGTGIAGFLGGLFLGRTMRKR
jgi:hypothetical protein